MLSIVVLSYLTAGRTPEALGVLTLVKTGS